MVLDFNLSAQNYPSKNINTSNGLPNNQVETILKDSRGILWIGTNNGLAKIENGEIKNFFKEDGLAHNSIWSIIEDTNNNLWFGTFGGGVTFFDGKKFKVFNQENGLVNNSVRKLIEYKNKVLVGTQNGLSIINLDNNEVEIINTEIEDFQVMDFFVFEDAIYCGTFRKGIFKIDTANKSVKKIFNYEIGNDYLFSIFISDSLFYYSVDGANNNYYKGTLKKFNIDNLLNNKKEDLIFGKSIIWDYALDIDNNLYGAAWGVYANDGGIYQIQNNTFIDRSKDFGITTANVKCLYFDKEFNFLYVGTIDYGVFQVDLNKRISYFKNDVLDIVDIENSKSNLALLCKNGLAIINNNKIINQIFNSDFLNFINKYISKNPIPYKDYNGFYLKDKNNFQDINFTEIVNYDSYYWISSNIGMFKLTYDGIIKDYHPRHSINFEFDYSGKLLSPIPYTAFRIYTSFKEYQHHKIFAAEDVNTPVNITDYSKLLGKIFISTSHKGLFLYDKEKFISLSGANSFMELELNHLSQIKENNTLVISTLSGDIYLVDVTQDFRILEKINQQTIIGNDILFLETYKDYVLIGTNEGLNIYRNGILQFIDKEQGLNNVEFTSVKEINGKLIIGTHNGYYELDLSKIITSSSINIDLKIVELSINHNLENYDKYKWFNYINNDLKLNHNQNTIEIDYIVNNHPYPNKLSYSFQVKGLDTTWSNYSSNSKINLPYLPSGNFDINVKIKDLNSGTVNESKLISLLVNPPFWKSFWFIIIVTIALIVLGIFIYKKSIASIKYKEQQKAMIQKRIVETKLEALQSQMNPHFTFNAMNSIQNYIIDNDIDNALMYLSEFAKLIRITLDNSSKHLILLAEEISYLNSYMSLENMRFNNKVKLTIDYQDLETNNIELPPMIVQPFVENAFVHAFTKDHLNPKLSIKFYIENQQLICEIEDNGKGLSETASGQLHQSKGLSLVSERLKLLNKYSSNSFKIISELGKGTKVIIQFELIEIDD